MPYVEWTDQTETVVRGVFAIAQMEGQPYVAEDDPRVLAYYTPKPVVDPKAMQKQAVLDDPLVPQSLKDYLA